jgi:hypothetical protein
MGTASQESGQSVTIKNELGEGALSSSRAPGTSDPTIGEPWNVDAPITFILDDGSHENSIGLTSNQPAIWLNRFSPVNADFPLQLNQISIQFPNPTLAGRDLTGLAVDLLVYVDADRDNDPSNAVKMAQLARTVLVADGVSFSNYPVSILIPTPGDLYIGFSDTYNNGQPPSSFPAPLDEGASQQRSWAIAASSGPPNYDNLGANALIIVIDDAGFPGNWVIRAAGETQVGGTATSTVAPPTNTAVTTATATVVPCTITFSDVPPTHTFYADIRCLACNGVLGGYADGTFRPQNNITRGQIAKVVSNAAGFSEPVTGQTYTDVPSTNTFYEWIERLTARGVMSGYPCGGVGEPCDSENRPYFRWGANATRGQLSKIVSNAAGFSEPVTGQTFTDVPPTNPFYTEIERLASRGIIGGYPCGGVGEPCDSENRPYFRWANPVTRGQAAKIVANTFFPECNPPAR